MNYSLAPLLCTATHWQHLCTCRNSEDCAFLKLCFRFRKNLYKSIWKYNVHRQTQGFTRGSLREDSSVEKEEDEGQNTSWGTWKSTILLFIQFWIFPSFYFLYYMYLELTFCLWIRTPKGTNNLLCLFLSAV